MNEKKWKLQNEKKVGRNSGCNWIRTLDLFNTSKAVYQIELTSQLRANL